MSWEVLLRPRAETDLEAARDWYEARQPGLGDAFIDEVSAALAQLEDEPGRHPEYYRDFRRIFIRRFPYKVFYLVEGNSVMCSASCMPVRTMPVRTMRGDWGVFD